MNTELFERAGKGNKHLLIGWPIKTSPELEKVLDDEDTSIFYLSKKKFDEIDKKIPRKTTLYGQKTTPDILRKIETEEWYVQFIKELRTSIKENKITHALAWYYFLSFNSLDVLKNDGLTLITFFGDDPEDTNLITKQYGPKYDKVICLGVQFNNKITIEEKFRLLGCKNVRFLPILPEPDHYDRKKIDLNNRDIEIVYVGALAWKKWVRLSKICSAFGNKIKIYSRYDPRDQKNFVGLAYRILNKFYPLPKTTYPNDSEIKGIYKRTKIGFNCHTSFGPSNSRLYELCLNGILQVTDNKKGTEKLFKVGEEVICFDDMSEAVKLITKYLKDDEERKRIALNGYKRAMKEYTYEEIFRRYIRYIFE
jgi:hypothetical protein